MKTHHLIIGLVLAVSFAVVSIPAHALAPVHIWSKGVGGTSNESVAALAVDNSGNVIIGGSFFGTINLGGTNLVEAGGGDMFIAGYNSSGVHQWSKRFGLGQDDVIQAVTTDAAGNVYFGGWFTGAQSFGGAVLPYSSNNDIMLVKFDASGNHLWSKSFGSTLDDTILGLAVDGAGNVIATGYFQNTIDFGGGGGGLTAAGTGDIFIIKYSSAGSYVWSKRLGAVNFEQGNAVVCDASSNIIVTGNFMNQVDFGGGLLSAHGASDQDLFVAKYNSSGAHLWSKSFGENSVTDEGNSVAVDASGNVYLTGAVTGSVNFGGGTTAGSGLRDAFLVKFDPAGTFTWAQRWGSSASEAGTDVAVDALGNVVLSGYFVSTMNLGGDTFTASGTSDFFLAEFASDGTHLRSQGWGSSSASFESATAVAVDPSRRVLLAGNFGGAMSVGGSVLANQGGTDVFLARYYIENKGPVITAIKDIGNDQGRVVNIAFQRANADDAPFVAGTGIVRYEAYRRTGPAPAASAVSVGTSAPGALQASGWQYVGQVPAHGAVEYTMDAPTLADSTVATGMYYSAYYLRAAASDPLTYYDSPADSGYSKDNLSPGVPLNFVYNDGQLSWDAPADADVDHFTVYGADAESFAASTLVNYAATPSLDVSASPYRVYYVTATDLSGNEGAPAQVKALSTANGPPKSYVLSVSNYPNPFNPRTTVSYTVPARGHVTVSIYDVHGALVATLVNGERQAGAYSVDWDGRTAGSAMAASGLYFARIEHASGTRTKKLVMLK